MLEKFLLNLIILSFLAQYNICLSAKVDIKVSDSPKLVSVVDEFNNPEDTNATITCSLGSGELQSISYEWYKDKERLYPSSNKVNIEIPRDNYQSVLRIFNLKPSDSAVYTCIAKNRFGQDKISTKLNVKVQLKWISEPTNVQVPAKKAVHIACLAEGVPEPTIEWRKIAASSGEEDKVIGSSLGFTSIERDDTGYYECKASNGVEEDLRSRIKLDVLGK